MKSNPETGKRQRRGHGRPTLHDVADAAGVTRITVSRFIRQPTLVAEATADRIREAIEHVGYVPNQQAGHLASGESRLVAALIPNVGHSIFAETIQGLTEGLRESAYELLLLSTGYSLEREETQLLALTGWAPGAIIVTGRQHTPVALGLLRDARASGIPVVQIWDHPSAPDASEGFAQIGFDHFATGEAMAQHLIDQGRSVLAYVDSGVAEDFRAHERGAGFLARARTLGVHATLVHAALGDAFDAGRTVLQNLWDHAGHRADAAAFANDHLACGALLEASRLGVDVPNGLALLGFGDFPLGRQLQPTLSTMRPPTADIGRMAAQAVLRSLMEGPEPESLEMGCKLIVRQSTGPIASQPARLRPPGRA